MNEIEVMKWQLGQYRAGLIQQIDRLYNALEELQRITLLLREAENTEDEAIDAWLQREQFAVDEDGFFQSIPLLQAFRNGKAPADAISFSWGQDLQSDPTARKRLYSLRNIGSHLKHVHDRLGDVGWIYYQDAANVALQYPYIDQCTAIPSDFDWSTYHTYVSVCPENNPFRQIRWTPPSIDYAGEGLILSVSIPVWLDDRFLGLWSIDLPIRYLLQDFSFAAILPEQEQFIADNNSMLVLHKNLHTEVDQPRGKIIQHSLAELGGDWRNIDVNDLVLEDKGTLSLADENGMEWIFCHSHVSGVDWTLFCGLPRPAMEEASAQRLQQAFQQIADGNYSHRIETSSSNALPTLIDEFNKMSLRLTQVEEHRQEMENQLRHAQKLEAVGRLAGGVAHDYNNMINVIMGYTEMALEKLDHRDPLHEDLLEIHEAAKRSMELTRQLLAFARRQSVAPKVLDINLTVDSMLKMLQHLIGEDIELKWSPADQIWPVRIDPTQVDQILANLCVNARDAIHGVGTLTITTKNVELDQDYCRHHRGALPGEYVELGVADDGIGIDADVLDKIFEPFFSTKAIGKGTGLGLATVYGIVKQNDGYIDVESEQGKGSTFKIYLPKVSGQSAGSHGENNETIIRGHYETVLLVEDETAILKLAQTMLKKLGYRVLSVTSPLEAINLAKTHRERIELLITDVVMPELNGRELASRLRQEIPGLKVLFMSGHTANVIAHRGILDEDVFLIQKPFSLAKLSQKIKEVLEKAADN